MSTPTLTAAPALRFHPLRDSVTMLRRNLKRMLRYPSMTVLLIGMPVIFLLLFVYVFGGTMGAGLGGSAADGRAAYANYLTPGILLMTVMSTVQGTAISIAMDMTEGIITRFRTMHIARVSVLTGHVIGSLIQAMLAVAVVTGVALLVGFDPTADLLGWLATAGFVAAVSFAFIWLAVALGQASGTVETASNAPMPLILLPFLSSGFVPTESLPAGIRWFAEYQPFTPIIETMRALLAGNPPGNDLWISLGWCAVIALGGYLWSKRLFNRESKL
ncbi:ABC-2 type transport system permease protein [Actinoplanes campanulatus]|uniref:Transport permease protein n=1 Tax=Actinoplanes campanulatus TaxID=113559 RepID=A0A7W5AQY1_9ACTN|nr:ABC transporter permease [Actinoplanes campanulatus]MBB3100670.1 ABC-2 type transport system permease protein [Actinoplanes campanulatus]GGN45576.1 transport permease protein [Actinoplanes campanulatus]GID41130.1 transport permease protein [Actinoplanes campanulatus]